jgi:hypothetical protein
MDTTPTPKMVLLVGVWRSGTSLLHALLHHHPQIALMYEAEMFSLYPAHADYIFPDDWAARLEFFNQTISRHRLDAAALPRGLSARDSMLALFRAWAARKNASVFGGKTVVGHTQLPQFARIFPEADFIVLWRDPLDICRSVVNAGKQNRFFSRRGILTQTLFGTRQLAEGVLKLRAAGRRVHEVVYPELVNDPGAELRKLCDFIGVPFAPEMLDLETADYSMLPFGEHHDRVRSGMVKRKPEGTEVLPAEFVAKGKRYTALWRDYYAGLAFARALPPLTDTHRPGQLESWLDRGIYRGCSSVTNFKRRIIRELPIPMWQQLREVSASVNR